MDQPEEQPGIPEQDGATEEEPDAPALPQQAAPLIVGGIYAMRERRSEPYRLVKLVHREKGFAHILRYAGMYRQPPADIPAQGLTTGVDVRSGSFGAEHIPLPEDLFAACTQYIRQQPLSDRDIRGYQLYVDSVFDCLHEGSPDWLRKAGSYAAWRNDLHAMAVLADHYLVGVDLPRDSRKALYWLNRIVQQGVGILRPGERIRQEGQILTGGIYARASEHGAFSVCKVVLKDRHGVQLLLFPAAFDRPPVALDPVQLLQEAAQAGKAEPFTHAAVKTGDFLAQEHTYIDLLPITIDEIHCYRTYLGQVFRGAEFQPSAFDLLVRQAEAGDATAQYDLAQLYLHGDRAWEVEQSTAEAVQQLTAASNLGHGLAAYHLALICREGADGIEANPQLSLEWLLYAAQLDCGLAQLHAADCCRHGIGCAPDLSLAHAWYSVAAVREGNDLTEEHRVRARVAKAELEADLSPEELSEARGQFRQLQRSF